MVRTPAVGVVALLLACATTTSEGGPESPVRLVAPGEVAWAPGGPFLLELEVRNASGSGLTLAKPAPEALQVRIYREPGGELACKTPSPAHRQYEGWAGLRVPSSKGVALKVDLWPYCRALVPGTYRYDATYVSNPVAAAGEILWTGTLVAPGGRVEIAEPAAGGSPAASGADGVATPAVAAPAEAARECVDRELAARGLNPFGDKQGTEYPGEPPADDEGRILYVAGRNAEIRRACGLGGR